MDGSRPGDARAAPPASALDAETKPLVGLRVHGTGLDPDQRELLRRQLKELGATFEGSLDTNNLPDVLVARSVMVDKYQLAMANSIPVVGLGWSKACCESMHLEPFDDHRLPPLAGTRISVTGFDVRTKERLAALIERGGGAHSPELSPACTHLIAETRGSEKCKAAERWGSIAILKPAWLAATLDAGAPAPPERYQLLPQPPRQPSGSDAGRLAPAKSAAVSRASGSLIAAVAAEGPAAMLPAPQPVVEAAAAGGGGVGGGSGGGGASPQLVAAGVSSNPFGSDIAETAPTDCDAAPPPRAATAAAPAPAAACAGGGAAEAVKLSGPTTSQQTSYSQPSQGVARPKGRGNYLGGVRLHITGCEGDERTALRLICRHGNALVHTSMAPSIRYIVVGSAPTAKELGQICSHMAQHRGSCEVVAAPWLQECAAQRQLAPADDFLLPLDALCSVVRFRLEMEAQGWAVAAAAVTGTESTWNVPSGSAAPTSSTATAARRLLDGCWFTLAAMEAASPEELAKSETLLKSAGARVFDQHTVSLATAHSKPNQRYAMCPAMQGLTREDAAALAARRPDFKLVAEGQRVTSRWVQESLAAGELQSLSSPNNRIIYRPLPFRVPLPAMQGVRLSASVYGTEEKRYLVLLAHMLGARFTSSMSSLNTHLLVPRRTGEKYARSGAHGVTPVVAAWLIDAAATGTVPDVRDKKYQPGPPAEDEEEAFRDGSQAPTMNGATGVENTQAPRGGPASQAARFGDISGAPMHSVARGAGMRPACLAERDGNCPPPATRPLRRPLELLQGPYDGADVAVAEQPAGTPAALGSAPSIAGGSAANAAAAQPSAATAQPPTGHGPPAASSAAATAMPQPGGMPHTTRDPAASGGATGMADASADAARMAASSVPLPSATPVAAATSAAAEPGAAASAEAPGRADTQAPAMQPPPAKPKPSLLDTLLPQGSGDRRTRRSAAKAAATAAASRAMQRTSSAPADAAAAIAGVDSSEKWSAAPQVVPDAGSATPEADGGGSGGSLPAPLRAAGSGGSASRASLLRQAVAAAAQPALAAEAPAADGPPPVAGSQSPVAEMDEDEAGWNALNGFVEHMQRFKPAADSIGGRLSPVLDSQQPDCLLDDVMPPPGGARPRPNRRLSAGESDGNSRGSGGRKRPGGPDSCGSGHPARGAKAPRSGSGGEAAAAAAANVVMASQMDCSQRVEYEMTAPARPVTRRSAAAAAATDSAAEASKARIAQLVRSCGGGGSGGSGGVTPSLRPSRTAGADGVSLQL